MKIIVRTEACDGYRATRVFKTIEKARACAVDRVGERPEYGSGYAVSFDGIVTVSVQGCTLRELFEGKAKPAEPDPHDAWAAEQARLDEADREEQRLQEEAELADYRARAKVWMPW